MHEPLIERFREMKVRQIADAVFFPLPPARLSRANLSPSDPPLPSFVSLKQTFMRKMTKARAKKQGGVIDRLKDQEPTYRLDRIIRERYVTPFTAKRR